LHRLLRDSLPAEALLIGSEADSVEQPGPGTVRVGCGETVLDADLVVAADGIGSKVRSHLFPAHPGPVYSGSTVLRAITEQAVDLRTDFELTWGHGAEFGHIAFHDGRAEWHAVLNLPAGTRFADPLAVALRNTAMRLTPSRAATHMILRHHAWVPPQLS
jgi:2-polyprenyl-6-methoxyphenol hydroxylase-like FAD-dependent oxidoreductase